MWAKGSQYKGGILSESEMFFLFGVLCCKRLSLGQVRDRVHFVRSVLPMYLQLREETCKVRIESQPASPVVVNGVLVMLNPWGYTLCGFGSRDFFYVMSSSLG